MFDVDDFMLDGADHSVGTGIGEGYGSDPACGGGTDRQVGFGSGYSCGYSNREGDGLGGGGFTNGYTIAYLQADDHPQYLAILTTATGGFRPHTP